MDNIPFNFEVYKPQQRLLAGDTHHAPEISQQMVREINL